MLPLWKISEQLLWELLWQGDRLCHKRFPFVGNFVNDRLVADVGYFLGQKDESFGNSKLSKFLERPRFHGSIDSAIIQDFPGPKINPDCLQCLPTKCCLKALSSAKNKSQQKPQRGLGVDMPNFFGNVSNLTGGKMWGWDGRGKGRCCRKLNDKAGSHLYGKMAVEPIPRFQFFFDDVSTAWVGKSCASVFLLVPTSTARMIKPPISINQYSP